MPCVLIPSAFSLDQLVHDLKRNLARIPGYHSQGNEVSQVLSRTGGPPFAWRTITRNEGRTILSNSINDRPFAGFASP